jgi:L,D-peptidoglycan transpeptidase YkuD (ErfK/YbiS/YcfS/YnhG family)
MPIIIQKGMRSISWQGVEFECQVGLNGFAQDKIEGDKKTPIGRFRLLHVYYRADKIQKPFSILPIKPIHSDMGWSDSPADSKYNKLVKLPHSFSHEKLYRNDNLYDLIITTSHNTNPTVPGKGSAIFIHIMNYEQTPTEGCLALRKDDLLHIVKTATPDSEWLIGEQFA